jgi:uroporphyrin-III C-methyltransferase
MLASSHNLAAIAAAAVLHSGRPTVVTVGAGALPVAAAEGGLTVQQGQPLPQSDRASTAP